MAEALIFVIGIGIFMAFDFMVMLIGYLANKKGLCTQHNHEKDCL